VRRADTGVVRLRRLLITVAAALVVAPASHASTIIDRNATDVTLQVNDHAQALVEYTVSGKRRHVLAWGAMNAVAPTKTRNQGRFKLDYSGGWGAFRKLLYGSFDDYCEDYDGPQLAWFVAGCKAPDGSYWALQAWQRMLPNLGLDPWLPQQSVWELHLSHWKGPLPVLDMHLDWVNTRKLRHVFGQLTYLGRPVHGFGSSTTGNPTDRYGRNVYLDVLNATGYGAGWRRENSFLAHNPGGNFCYGFYPHKPYAGYPSGDRPSGNGERYRATVIGPGVLPDVSWESADIGEYDKSDPAKVAYEQQMNALGDQLAAGDRLCRQH